MQNTPLQGNTASSRTLEHPSEHSLNMDGQSSHIKLFAFYNRKYFRHSSPKSKHTALNVSTDE